MRKMQSLFKFNKMYKNMFIFIKDQSKLFIFAFLSQIISPFFLKYYILCCLTSPKIKSSKGVSNKPKNLSSYPTENSF